MLCHGLARSEAAGNCGGAALGDGEEGVDDALARDERKRCLQTLRHRTRRSDRPVLAERQLMQGAPFIAQHRHRVGHFIFAVGLDRLNHTAQSGRHHAAMFNDRRFGAYRVDVAAFDFITGLHAKRDVPLP